ncbi:MAG: pitrilysin family protein [Candidatus Sericytochromatia bacterium]|nr:pitrilysin family protein [Candidatus Sericytochromatia bacterium]
MRSFFRSSLILGLCCLTLLPTACVSQRLPRQEDSPKPRPLPTRTPEPAPRPFTLPASTQQLLPNGMRITHLLRRHVPLVTIHVVVEAGSLLDEPGLTGQALLTAEMLQRGTESKSAATFTRLLDATGGKLRVKVEPDATMFTVTVPQAQVTVATQLLAEMLQRPLLSPADLVDACEDQKNHLRAMLDDPDWVADEALRVAVFGGHPYGRALSLRAIDATMRRDIRRFYQSWYRPNRTHLVVVGNVPANEIFRQTRVLFGTWRVRGANGQKQMGGVVKMPKNLRLWLVDMPLEQAYLRWGTGTPSRRQSYAPGVDALNFILGGDFTSRLNQKIRDDAGLAYGAYSQIDLFRDFGYFSARTNTRAETTRRTLDLLLSVVRGLRRSPPGYAEVVTAQRYLSGAYPLRFETNLALAEEVGVLRLNQLSEDSIAGYRARVRRVTSDDLGKLAKLYLPNGGGHLVVVGDKRRVFRQLAGFGAITVIPRASLIR